MKPPTMLAAMALVDAVPADLIKKTIKSIGSVDIQIGGRVVSTSGLEIYKYFLDVAKSVEEPEDPPTLAATAALYQTMSLIRKRRPGHDSVPTPAPSD